MVHPLSLTPEKITTVPIRLNELVLRHCHLDADAPGSDAGLLTVYQLAAIAWFERETKRSVVARSHRWVLQGFPCDTFGKILLPKGKAQSVQSVQYVTSGQTTTLTGPSASPAAADFQEDLYSDEGGILMPAQGSSWPSTDCDVPAPVVITFIAGWTSTELPEDVLRTLLFYVSDCVELRGTSDVEFGGDYLEVRNAMAQDYALRRVY